MRFPVGLCLVVGPRIAGRVDRAVLGPAVDVVLLLLIDAIRVRRVLQLVDRDRLIRAGRVVVGLRPVRRQDAVNLQVRLPGIAAGDAAVRRTCAGAERSSIVPVH